MDLSHSDITHSNISLSDKSLFDHVSFGQLSKCIFWSEIKISDRLLDFLFHTMAKLHSTHRIAAAVVVVVDIVAVVVLAHVHAPVVLSWHCCTCTNPFSTPTTTQPI